MNKKIVVSFLAAAVLAGCDYNEKYFEGLQEGAIPSDVKKLEYTLTNADYATIAANAANKALAGKEHEKELDALKTNMYFSGAITADKYVPAFLAAKWFTADDGSSVKLTYQNKIDQPEYITRLNTASIYKITSEEYESVWGAVFPFFSPVETAQKHVPAILKSALPDAVEGDIALVDYNQSENEPGGSVVAINETFEGIWSEKTYTAEVDGWNNVTTVGTYAWGGYINAGNCFLNASANGHKAGALEIYMISPRFGVTDGMHLTFDACYGYYTKAGGRLSVLISENLAGFTPEDIAAAQWDDITSSVTIPIPTGNYGTLSNVCDYDMSAYKGKKVYIAFRYNGDSTVEDEDGKFATTTVQLDNVVIKSEGNSGGGEDVYEATNSLFSYDGNAWSAYTDAISLAKADFKSMGLNYDNFNASLNPDNYLPQFLTLKYPFAQEENTQVVAYKFYNSSTKETTVRADEYLFTEGVWTKKGTVVTATGQFVLSDGKWNFDPSTTITLSTSKADTETSAFYQTITDWVKENKGAKYVTTYGNNDYYYGGSAYQNNFDFRTSKWKEQANDEYGKMSDEELTALMFERLTEAFLPGLEAHYADADVVSGVDVTYTINFYVYDGTATTAYVIKYLVTGKGKFEYIAESLQKQ